jgi:BlaI family penicillinase repressor
MIKPCRVSEAELLVLKAIWKQPGSTALQIIEAVSPATRWSPPTIKTLLNRLLHKKALFFKQTGKSYLYFPAFSENEFQKAEADSFVERVFDGALSPMLAHFAKTRRLTKDDLHELTKILRKGGEAP